MIRTLSVKKVLVAGLAVVATACIPLFNVGSTIDSVVTGPNSARLVWNTAEDVDYPDPGHEIANYEIWVNGALVASPAKDQVACLLTGLAGATLYDVEIQAVTTGGERGDQGPLFGVLSTSFTTPAGGAGGTIDCVAEADTDGDRIPDWAETNTGVFVDKTDTGTDPAVADTDGDAIADGDEVYGTENGLSLPLMGANPNRKTIFMEIDWFDDSLECGAHSHRPTTAMVDRVVAAFAAAPVSNPDGSTGIDFVVDYGQGIPFTGGSRVDDLIGVVGNIDGDVNGAQYATIKNDNFSAVRENYFHYALHIHRYNTNSGSSGYAEIWGDDQIVSLYCFEGLTNTSNTIMHELGHNLGLFHGGNQLQNNKPNYNSIMNYDYQFPGIDRGPGETNGCDTLGDQILSYSVGNRNTLDESALDESVGVCGGVPIDWNNNLSIDPGTVAVDVNIDGAFQTLTDHDDWSNLFYASVSADGADGARVGPTGIVEQPVPVYAQQSNHVHE